MVDIEGTAPMTDLELYDHISNPIPLSKILCDQSSWYDEYWPLLAYYVHTGHASVPPVVIRAIARELASQVPLNARDKAREIFLVKNSPSWRDAGAIGTAGELKTNLARLRRGEFKDGDTLYDLYNYLIIFMMAIDSGIIGYKDQIITRSGNSYSAYKDAKALRYMDSIKYDYRTFPPSLQVGITDKCMNQCYMCGHWRRPDKTTLPFNDLRTRVLDYGAANGLESVCYSGGDPMCLPRGELVDLMCWHKAKDVAYGFITAGYVPEKRMLDSEFKDLIVGASFIRCSVDSLKNYSTLRGGSLNIEQVANSVSNLRCAGAKVGLGITIHDRNANEIKALTDFAIDLDIREVRMWVVRNDQNILPDTKYAVDLYRALVRLSALGISNNLDLTIDAIYNSEDVEFQRCISSLYQFYINAKGDVYACCITAGEPEELTNDPPVANIYSCHREAVLVKLKKWSERKRCELPKCCDHCIPRTSHVNRCWDERSKDKCFI